VIEVYSTAVNAFSERHPELLSTLAAAAATTIGNARLYSAEQQARREAQRLQALTQRLGRSVTAALDGQRAVELAAGRRPDLVVLDMSGPHLDGAAVADELRPILLFTADGMAEEKARRVEAFDFLPKPFDLDRLLGIVQRRLGSSI
jgi:CheY-like chemotaxis protein